MKVKVNVTIKFKREIMSNSSSTIIVTRTLSCIKNIDNTKKIENIKNVDKNKQQVEHSNIQEGTEIAWMVWGSAFPF